MAVTSNYANLYVANQGDNSLVHFAIDTTGKLTLKDTVTLDSQAPSPSTSR